MEFQDILFTEQNNVATIALNRPQAYNAISDTMRNELRMVVDHIRTSQTIRAVVITGVGKVFCAGGDIKLMKERIESEVSFRERLETYRRDVAGMVKEIRSIRQPLIAQINGAAYGAGCSIAMLCDVRIAADTAKFGLPFGKRGLIPDWGATYFLPRIVGIANAIALTATGRSFDAAEALRTGFVSYVAPADALQAYVEAFCADMMESSPLATMAAKEAMYAGLDAEIDTVLEQEAQLQSMCYRSDDHREGVDCFLEKRPAVFTGR